MSKPTATIGSVDKACRLLKEAAAMGVFGLSDMARALGEPTSSVDRLINTLADHGFLERSKDKWRIGKAAADMWVAYRQRLRSTIEAAKRGLAETDIPGEPENQME